MRLTSYKWKDPQEIYFLHFSKFNKHLERFPLQFFFKKTAGSMFRFVSNQTPINFFFLMTILVLVMFGELASIKSDFVHTHTKKKLFQSINYQLHIISNEIFPTI